MTWLRAAGTLALEAPNIHFLDVASDSSTPDSVRGVVTLTLRWPLTLSSLLVRLGGKAEIIFEDGSPTLRARTPGSSPAGTTESTETFNEVVDILRGRTKDLVIGKNVLAFGVPVHLRTPATETCRSGAIEYTLTATAPGLASFGYDLVAERPIALVASPAGKDQPPPAVEHTIEDAIEDLGRLRISSWSPMLTVGGFLSIEIAIMVGLRLLSGRAASQRLLGRDPAGQSRDEREPYTPKYNSSVADNGSHSCYSPNTGVANALRL
jgi:hypothetical protein